MNDFSKNIKKVLFVFLVFFIVLISYITYFEIYKAPSVVKDPSNKRLWVKRNEVLRGTIYDRNKKALTQSNRVDELTQNRKYIGGEAFAHVLGYVDPVYGITGLEKKYDEELMKEEVSISSYLSFDDKKQEKIGRDLVTTIDSELQTKAYDLLKYRVGAVVAIDPKTGEILALVSTPSFDPNKLKDSWQDITTKESRPLLNRAVSGMYPPGSTFKTITAVSALDNISGIKSKTYVDNGKLVFNEKEFLTNNEGEELGNLSFKNAFVHSSNVVFGTLGMELGNHSLKTTAEKFYFNKSIPCDGIIIDNSRFPTYKNEEKGNIAQSAIGQSGVLATPMQMALVASTIANDGIMMKPHLVNQVVTSTGEVVREIAPESLGVITSKENAAYMKDLMRDAVAKGTGSKAKISGIEVCGKTGTAENNSKGENSASHAWFIAFAPYDDPKIAIAVIVENGGFGGAVSAPIAKQLINSYLRD